MKKFTLFLSNCPKRYITRPSRFAVQKNTVTVRSDLDI